MTTATLDTLDTMTPAEVNALATQVIRDRLVGFRGTGAPKGRVRMIRMLPPTEAELRWEALCAPHRPVRATLAPITVHPGVVALAAKLKAAAAR